MKAVRRGALHWELACYSATAVLAAVLAAAAALDSTELWAILSALGEELAYVGLALSFAYLFDYEAGVTVLAALLSSGSLNIFLKYLLGIPRPPPELWRAPAAGPGFPSGHAQTSATFWSGVSATARRLCVSVLSAAVVLSVATSRVALRVHSVPDVIGGTAIGVLVASVSALLLRRLGAGKTALLLALSNAALSSWNLASGHEVHTSASLLGLGVGMAVSAPIVRRSSEAFRSLGPRARLAALAAIFAVSLALTFAVRGGDPVSRVAAYSAVGFAIAAGPAILRSLLAGGGRSIFWPRSRAH